MQDKHPTIWGSVKHSYSFSLGSNKTWQVGYWFCNLFRSRVQSAISTTTDVKINYYLILSLKKSWASFHWYRLEDWSTRLPFPHQQVLCLVYFRGNVMADTSIGVVRYHDPLVSLLDLVDCGMFSENPREAVVISNITTNWKRLKIVQLTSRGAEERYYLTPWISAASLRVISLWNPPG
jgi:hypothetical protein